MLYCYGNCGDLAEWIPPSGGATNRRENHRHRHRDRHGHQCDRLHPRRRLRHQRGLRDLQTIALGAAGLRQRRLSALARQAIAIAQAAEASVNDLSNAVGQNTSKIATLWDAVFSEITTNPFQITFADLTGITLTAGIWNSGLQRLEC